MRYTYSHVPAVLLAIVALAAPVTAQGPQVAPNLPQPRANTTSTANVVAVPVYQPVPVVNPAAYNPAYGYYPSSPYGSYLSGRADLVTVRANAQVTQQQANLVQQDAYRSMIQSRQAILDQARYERANTMNSEDVRLQKQMDAVRRARNDPPLNEIWSGDSLNALFGDIKKAHTYGVRGPAVPLDPDILKNINLTTGVTVSNVGLLKDGPKLKWPVVLQDPTYQAERGQLETSTALAIEQAMKGPVDQALIRNMRDTVEQMQVMLKQQIANLAPGPYMDGKRYLAELDSSYAALKDPNVSNYFNGKYAAQGATVAELVDFMIGKGLTFAPAVSGGQPSYTALQQALVSYDLRLSQVASR